MADNRSTSWRWLVLPLLVALLAHGVGLASGFAEDDTRDIVQHPVVRGDVPVTDVLAYNFVGDAVGEGPNTQRPLVTLLFAAQWRVSSSPFLFHLVSLVWFCVAVLCFERLLRRAVRPRTALVGSIAFAALAIHVDAVGIVSNSAETIALVFVLLALLATIDRQPVRAALYCFAALLSKESAVLMPLLAGWWLFATGGRAALRSHWVPLAAVAAVTASFVIVRAQLLPFGVEGIIPPADNGMIGAPLTVRLWMPFVLIGHYIHLALVPVGLSFDYSYAVIPVNADVSRLHGWLGVATLVGLAWVALRRRGTADAASAGMFALTLLLVCNTVALLPAIFAERLFMTPSACGVLFACCIGERVVLRPALQRVVAIAGVLLCVMQVGLAAMRSREVASDLTLFASQVRTQPASVRGHYLYARELVKIGAIDEAIWELGVASYGRTHFPRAFEPPQLDELPIADRLQRLPDLLAPGTPPSTFWRAFARTAGSLLGARVGQRAEALAEGVR